MRRVAFTGPSKLTTTQLVWASENLDRLPLRIGGEPDVVVTGGAPGLDMLAAWAACRRWPHAEYVVVVPAAPYAEAEVARLVKRFGVTVLKAPDRATPAEAYRARNLLMVATTQGVAPGDDCYLAAFLKSDRFYRSGEWMTVNLARGHLRIEPFLLP